MKMCAATPT